jgi:hypothetical protein
MSEQCAQGRGNLRPKVGRGAASGRFWEIAFAKRDPAFRDSHSGLQRSIAAIRRGNFCATGLRKLKSRQIPAALPARWSSRCAACSNR